MLNQLIPIASVVGTALVIITIIILGLMKIYKVADVDKVLIITGGREPKIKISGGSFVIPVFRKASYFDLCILTVTADRDEIRTVTSVPIVTDWTAQIRPDTTDENKLLTAIMSFKERGPNGIINDVKLTLTGAVRDVVSSMTPEEVLKEKQKFQEKVKETVADELNNMGLALVSLNIQDVYDNNGYYDNIAALDMSDKEREAENKKARVNQEIRAQKAEAEKVASQVELDSQLAIAEKTRDNEIKQAEYKAETDTAKANADVAGILQETKRKQDIAEEEGRVEVIRQEQYNLAAQKEQEVVKTRSESRKIESEINAQADANVQKINADMKVEVAKKDAEAVKTTADAQAAKILKEGEAQAEISKKKGIAEAEAKRAQLLAEAEGEKAKLLAQAEGEKALSDARSANNSVNFEIEKVKIDANARIQIATKTAEIMAEVGKNAEFVNISGNGGSTGNSFLDTLGGLPELLKIVDTKNQALNGQSFTDQIKSIVSSIAEPIKGSESNKIPLKESKDSK